LWRGAIGSARLAARTGPAPHARLSGERGRESPQSDGGAARAAAVSCRQSSATLIYRERSGAACAGAGLAARKGRYSRFRQPAHAVVVNAQAQVAGPRASIQTTRSNGMSRNLLICATLASIGLLGCQAMPRAAAPYCNPGLCRVEVSVVDCVVSLQPDRLPVPERGRGKNIHWDIMGNEYVFAANGIVIDRPDGEFDARELSHDGKKFKWHNKHTKQGDYKYSVNVIKTGVDPRACPTHDPVISNE
jgi:hypothetical protein